MTQASFPGSAPRLEVDGQIATVRLCRPDQANRLEAGDLQVLDQHFRELQGRQAQVRAVILTGSGRHFSAGFDLGALDSAVKNDASAMFASMVDMLESLPQTTICAINGGVFGGATDLALACDFRLGVHETRMFMPAARFGLHYYESGLRRYLTRLGLNAAKRLFLLAEEIDAQELLAIGYLTRVVSAETLQDEALSLARRASGMAPLASAGMKSALNTMAAGTYDRDHAQRIYLACMSSADLREGLLAVREKRLPRFEAN